MSSSTIRSCRIPVTSSTCRLCGEPSSRWASGSSSAFCKRGHPATKGRIVRSGSPAVGSTGVTTMSSRAGGAGGPGGNCRRYPDRNGGRSRSGRCRALCATCHVRARRDRCLDPCGRVRDDRLRRGAAPTSGPSIPSVATESTAGAPAATDASSLPTEATASAPRQTPAQPLDSIRQETGATPLYGFAEPLAGLEIPATWWPVLSLRSPQEYQGTGFLQPARNRDPRRHPGGPIGHDSQGSLAPAAGGLPG